MPRLRHTRQCDCGVLLPYTAKPVRTGPHTLEAWLAVSFTSCEVFCLHICACAFCKCKAVKYQTFPLLDGENARGWVGIGRILIVAPPKKHTPTSFFTLILSHKPRRPVAPMAPFYALFEYNSR